MSDLADYCKWISLFVTAALGTSGLFFRTYKENPRTKRRSPTQAVWVVLILMSFSFTASVVLLVLGARETRKQLRDQQDQIFSLRKIALTQWKIIGLVVALGFTPERWKSLLGRYPEVSSHPRDGLTIDDGVVGYTPYQDTRPLTYEIFPEDDDYKDFKGFMNEICSFTITMNEQSELARCETDKWPAHVEIGSDGSEVKMRFKPPELPFLDFDQANVRVEIETENAQDAPVPIKLESLDPHLSFEKPIIPQWTKKSREIGDEQRGPVTINYLESKPQILEVDFPGLLPKARPLGAVTEPR